MSANCELSRSRSLVPDGLDSTQVEAQPIADDRLFLDHREKAQIENFSAAYGGPQRRSAQDCGGRNYTAYPGRPHHEPFAKEEIQP
jgi:hypothetical protein